MKLWQGKVDSMITASYTHHGKDKGVFRNRIKFPNGWGVSWVANQAGCPENLYCERGEGVSHQHAADRFQTTQEWRSVEVAVFDPAGEMVQFEKSGDTVKGWVTAAELVQILLWASQQTNSTNSFDISLGIGVTLTEKWYGHLNTKTTNYLTSDETTQNAG
jgi:hypothetical protein